MKQACIILWLATGVAFGQDMRENLNRSLFADQKATRIGDAVTVLIIETSSTSNDAKTASSRASDLSFNASGKVKDTQLPGVGLAITSGNKFQGEGSSASNNSVRAKVSARVDSVLLNGNLFITGNRTILVNGEEQTIHVSGIVRPSDIQGDNSVYSYNISDANITFSGNGIVTKDAQSPGLLTKVFHWLF